MMKHYLLLLTYLLLCNVTAQKSKTSAVYVHRDLDVFSQHIKILDSIIKVGYDNSNLSYNSVRYMERVTQIKAHGDGDHGGFKPFTWLDLNLWKTWYKNIGSKRIGIIN